MGQNLKEVAHEEPDGLTYAERQKEWNHTEHGEAEPHAEQKIQEEEEENLAEDPVESRWEYPRPGTYDSRQQLHQGGPLQRQALAGADGTDYQRKT